MMKKYLTTMVVIALIAGGSFLSGCVQQQQQGNGAQPDGADLGSGTLRLLIKDKPGEYTIVHVNITISQVQVHLAASSNDTENQSSGGAFNVTTNGPYEADVGELIQFLGNASDGQEPYNWSWDFGDGSNSSMQNPLHTYVAQGIYPVNLTVTDNNNTTAWARTIAYIGQEDDENESGWITIVNESQTFDLIALQNITALLGEKNLTVGKYTQIRLTVESADLTINRSGAMEEQTLKVPSSKIKLIHPFTITKNETTVLTLDFLVDKSIHETGNGKFMLTPTIKIIQG